MCCRRNTRPTIDQTLHQSILQLTRSVPTLVPVVQKHGDGLYSSPLYENRHAQEFLHEDSPMPLEAVVERFSPPIFPANSTNTSSKRRNGSAVTSQPDRCGILAEFPMPPDFDFEALEDEDLNLEQQLHLMDGPRKLPHDMTLSYSYPQTRCISP
jgi:hypothetical protein